MSGQQKLLAPSVILRMAFYILIIPFLPLLISRRWGWWEAWVYAALTILGSIVSRLLAVRRHPDLLSERAQFARHQDAEPWDKLLAPLIGLGGSLIPLVAGLEMLIRAWARSVFRSGLSRSSCSSPAMFSAPGLWLKTASFPEWCAFKPIGVTTSFQPGRTGFFATRGTSGACCPTLPLPSC